jgi:hypothetical protein
MKNYLKPTLLALLISTACACGKLYESVWVKCPSPFTINVSYPKNVTQITTSQDGLLIHVVAKSSSGQDWLYKSTDGGVTWFILEAQ